MKVGDMVQTTIAKDKGVVMARSTTAPVVFVWWCNNSRYNMEPMLIKDLEVVNEK